MTIFPEITKSRARQKLLNYFFANPEANLYVREAASLLKEDAGNLCKELAGLEKIGVFTSKVRGRQKYFSLNRQYPLYKELESVVFKTIGVKGRLKELVDAVEGVRAALIYGSFAQGRQNALSDIDLLIIGKLDEDNLMEKIDNLEKLLHREINYNIYSEKEFKEKLKRKDIFVMNILKRPKVFLKGNLHGV